MMRFDTNIKTTRRLGKWVFRMNGDLWRECKRLGVTDDEIKAYHKDMWSLGIYTDYEVAAAIAVRDRKRKP